MPQLNKIRIVNFFYNDGNRLIADELYDFKNINAKAPNVLINLANGGGKSVLVQLIMQPILPKAKASGRKIESFFTKPDYHSYILLEWQKDNSPEKLLTGISMRTATSSDKDENIHGRKIQYYTFYAEYMQNSDIESITSLELSKKQNGNFVAADYNYIKKLSKNQNRLQCYSQEKNREWKEKLQEFYIYPNEWEMIEKINSVEGGLDKFFEDYRSSDSLIDKLMIPAIENQIHGENIERNADDTSLTTMFLGYADSYRKSSDNLKKQELYQKYKSALMPFVSSFKELFDLEDKVRTSKRKLYGFADALITEKSQQKINKTEIYQKIQKNKDEITKIKHEEASAKYYSAKKDYEDAKKEKEVSENNLNNLKQKEEQLIQDIKIQECTEYFEKIKQLENEVTIIQKKIESLENHSDLSQEIRNLKYSVHMLAENQIERLSKAITDEKNVLSSKKLEQIHLSNQVKKFERELQEIQKEISTKYGGLEQIKEYTDNTAKQHKFDITRNILGVYESIDIMSLKNRIQDNLEKQKSEQQNIIENINDLAKQSDIILNQIVEVNKELNSHNYNKNIIQSAIGKYELAYEVVYKICEEYQLDAMTIFSGNLTDKLKNLLSDREVNAIQLKNKIQAKEKIMSAAKKGNVHIHEEIIDFLNAEHISYVTCESYLLTQIEKKIISSEQVLKLLEKYPFIAYSVIMENSEYEKICNHNENQWLSISVYVFNNQEFDKYLQQSMLSQKFIANYSSQLFVNQGEFLENLQKEIILLKNQLEIVNQEIEEISKKYSIVTNFEYSLDWLSTQKHKLQEVEKNIKASNEQIQNFKNQKKIFISKTEEQEFKKDVINQKIEQSKLQLKDLENMIDNIQKEQKLSEEIIELENKLQINNRSEKNLTYTLNAVNQMIDELESNIIQHNKQLDYTKEAYNDTKLCEESKMVNGSLEELYQQYQKLSQKQSSDIETLKDIMNVKSETIASYEKEIAKREIDKSLYQNAIYNQIKYEKMQRDLLELMSDLKECEYNYHKKDKECDVAQHRLETCTKGLKIFGEPFPKNQIHMNFTQRIQETEQIIDQLNSNLFNTEHIIDEINNVLNRLEDNVGTLQRNEDAIPVQLQKDIKTQFNNLRQEWNNNKEIFFKILNREKLNLESVIGNFEQDTFNLKNTLLKLKEMLNMAEGEYIYSLNEMLEKYINNADRMIHKIKSDLADLECSKHHLSRQCVMHAKQIYEGLEQIKNSKVKVYENKQPKNMLKIDIPDSFNLDSAQKIMESELETNVEQFVSREFSSEEQMRKEASKIVSSGRLLRIAIQKNNLIVKAYKIDQNPDNAKYRTWEESLKNNSGAEKFIVYLSIILSIMNYSKFMSAGIQNNSAYSLLILDNPFGSTTSPHILSPMFSLAKYFKVQMICLTHITQNDVVKCFDYVIKAFVRKMAMSSKELLQHKSNDETEVVNHGFYSVSEQMSLF